MSRKYCQVKNRRGRRAQEAPPTAEKLVAADGWWKGGGVSFLHGCSPWQVISVPVDGPVPVCHGITVSCLQSGMTAS